MDVKQVSIRLRPARDAHTTLSLSLTLPASLTPASAKRLCELLSDWSQRPICVALPANGAATAWFDDWADALATVPDDRLEIRFVVGRTPRTRAHKTAVQ